jgi:type II secretory pathway component GspD/PulD (secretin)
MRLLRRFVFLGLLVVCPPGSTWATPSEPFSFENADILTVVKHIGRLTGITFIFDPEQVTGKITLLSLNRVSPAEALELLKLSPCAATGFSAEAEEASGSFLPNDSPLRP